MIRSLGLSNDEGAVLAGIASKLHVDYQVLDSAALKRLPTQSGNGEGGLLVVNQFGLTRIEENSLARLSERANWRIVGTTDPYVGGLVFAGSSRVHFSEILQRPFAEAEVAQRLHWQLEQLRIQRQLESSEKRWQRLLAAQLADNQLARELIADWMPPRTGAFSDVRYASFYRPAAIVGGDFYGLYPLGDRHLGILMVDVAGHGFASTLSGLAVMRWFSEFGHQHLLDDLERPKPVDEVVLDLQDNLIGLGAREARYLTLVYATLSLETGVLTYVRAGHTPLLILSEDRIEVLEAGDPPVGLWRVDRFHAQSYALSPGDRLFLYTDGLTDQLNPAAQPFGEQRVTAALKANSGAPVEPAMGALIDDFSAWSDDDASHDDDVCALLLHWQPEGVSGCPRSNRILLLDAWPPSQLEAASSLAVFIADLLLSHVTSAQAEAARLVVMEWLVNVVRHGAGSPHGSANRMLRVRISLLAAMRVELIFNDNGIAFDPIDYLARVPKRSPDQVMADYLGGRTTLGLGLPVIDLLVESMEYRRLGDENQSVCVISPASAESELRMRNP